MIEVDALSRKFGPILAVDHLSFAVPTGQVLGLLGPNGAGKTTTMRVAAGFLAPTAGTVRLAGIDVRADPVAVRRRLGYLPEGAPLYPDMTPAGLLRFVAEVRGMRGSHGHRAVDRVVWLLDLAGVLDQAIETLSKGFRRRLALATALIHDPEVLVLDEPTEGLDPNQKRGIRALIAEMAPTKAIVLSTHSLEEVEAVCSRTLIIAKGRAVADGTPADLIARSGAHSLDDVFRAVTDAGAVRPAA